MKPGDTTGPQSLLVTNNGTLDLSYTMSTTMDTDTGTPLLGDELNLTIWQDINQDGCTAPSTGNDSAEVCGAADLNDGAVGIGRDEGATVPVHWAPTNCPACGLVSVSVYSYGHDTGPRCHGERGRCLEAHTLLRALFERRFNACG